MYQVYRKIGAGEAVALGGTGSKKFVDTTLPAGSSEVTYQLQAIRTTGVGAWASFVVKIGVSGSGAMSAAVTSETPVKLAA